AVSIGTVHGRMRGTPRLDFERLAAINARVQRPLVIHGGTGLDDGQFRRLIENGVAKINYYTALADAAAARIRANQREGAGYTALLDGVREAVAEETARCMRVFGSAGRADEVLAVAEPWRPVEHVILYNVAGLDDAGVEAMMRTGREVLSGIPGVRRVITGRAVQEGARYRFAWIVEFVHPAVIDSYREHPDHVAFADTHFRPVAGDRVSIDYQAVE
ncbi:MAG TPA: fructose-bisphosphate aldolase, partial [Chromatiales bacterium]|nr:fructose-bisphosphate aldolase [Chromatiales bacterium]